MAELATALRAATPLGGSQARVVLATGNGTPVVSGTLRVRPYAQTGRACGETRSVRCVHPAELSANTSRKPHALP